MMRRIASCAVLLALVACQAAAALPKPKLPTRILPATIGGYQVKEEKNAAAAYKTSYEVSLVSDGKVFTLRDGDRVVGSLQIGVLKPQYRTTTEAVRRGIRDSIETGRYRWFKMAGQWVGEQRLQEISLYLWYPPGGRTYEVLVVRPELGIPKQLLAQIVIYQKVGP